MSRYILRRLLLTLPVFFGVSVLVFLILHMSPGDPALMIAGADAPPETIQAVRHELGLDQPLYQQYATYLGRVVQGDLGRSVRSKEPVTKLIGDTFPKTATLALVALVLGVVISLPLGIMAAVRRNSWVDNLTRLAAFMGVSMPVFAVGLLLMWLFAYKLRVLPLSGYGGPIWTVKGLKSVILPALTSASFSIAVLVRITRSSMLEVIGQDFIRTARAKGLGERMVVYKHALRNALLPVITVLGVQFGGLMGGAVVTETIFAWPGMGRMALSAIFSRDFPVVQGVVLLVAVMFVTVNLLVDLAYGFVDPRIQYD